MTSNDLSKSVTLLSSIYVCQPTADAVSTWKELLSAGTPPFLEDVRAALEMIDIRSEETLENLLWEYTRLFIGPYRLPCPPWESVYTSPKGLLMQEAAVTAATAYENAGLAIDDPAIMPDHIGIELNFLALLLSKMESNASEAAGKFGKMATKFRDEHLAPWVPRFTRDLETAAETTLYKSVARATANLMVQLKHEEVRSL